MDSDVKNHIMNVMKMGTGGCRHLEMSEALRCPTCQMKMVKAESELKRLSKEYPEKFIRKEPDYPDSSEVQNMAGLLEDRCDNDKLYREHLRLMALGTSEEKLREYKREMNGFYQRHTGGYRRKIL